MKSIREIDQFVAGEDVDRRAAGRLSLRFDKAFPVVVGSELFGDTPGVARNISPGGMMVEMPDPVPLGCAVTVRFRMPEGSGQGNPQGNPQGQPEIAALAEVKHHYCFNYGEPLSPTGAGHARGIGLRFVEFVEDGEQRWMESFTRARVLH